MPTNQNVNLNVIVDNPRPPLTANLAPLVIAIFLFAIIICLILIFWRRRKKNQRSGPL
ncbi:MAG: hypothetical protein WAV56_00640 [Microgenomates group bacterium]